MKKTYVLIGNFGSGKTELALNLAFRSAKHGRTELIDLDMINTYFRLSERKSLIEAAGIRLVSPNYVMTNIESLSLPAEVSSAFHMDWDTVIFDVGGDSAGATALGRYKSDFDSMEPGSLEVLNVINIRRPMSGTADRIIALMGELERKSRLKITGLVNNTNLASATGPGELRDGYETLREVSERSGVPLMYTTGRRELLDVFLAEGHDERFIGRSLEIVTYLHRDWENFTRFGV